jgi:hypothetical protein
MKKNDKNDEPRDEFDHVMLPGFMAKPLSFFQGSAGTAGPAASERPVAEPTRRDGNPNSGNPFSAGSASSAGTDPYDPDSYRTASDSDAPRYADEEAEAEASRKATPTKWWAGSRGRLLIYVGSAVLWIFIQSRN